MELFLEKGAQKWPQKHKLGENAVKIVKKKQKEGIKNVELQLEERKK